jgi:hypothetical protein
VRGRYSLKNIPPKKARRKDKFTRVMTGKNIFGNRGFIGTQCKIFLFIIEVRKRGGGFRLGKIPATVKIQFLYTFLFCILIYNSTI